MVRYNGFPLLVKPHCFFVSQFSALVPGHICLMLIVGQSGMLADEPEAMIVASISHSVNNLTHTAKHHCACMHYRCCIITGGHDRRVLNGSDVVVDAEFQDITSLYLTNALLLATRSAHYVWILGEGPRGVIMLAFSVFVLCSWLDWRSVSR